MSTETAKLNSKRELYLQKFLKYKEEKTKVKKDGGEKSNLCSTALKQKNTTENKNVAHVKNNHTTIKTQPTICKENNKPATKTPNNKPLPKQTVTSLRKQPNSNMEKIRKSFPIDRKNGSTLEPRVNSTKSSVFQTQKSIVSSGKPAECVGKTATQKNIHTRKSTGTISGSQTSLSNKNNGPTRKSIGHVVSSRTDSNINGKTQKLTGTSQSKVQSDARRSFSTSSFNRNRQSVHNDRTTKTGIVKKGRRHSDAQKEKTKSKPTSILKRKSCFASFEVGVELDGKTPDHGRSVRFISPDVQEAICSNNRYRKTPRKPHDDSSCSLTPKPSVKRAAEQLTPLHSAKKVKKNEEQLAMRNKLDDWLKAKGKTPSKFRHLMCFHEKGDREPVDTDSCMKRALTVEELTEQKAIMDTEDSVVVNLADQFRDAALEELDSMLEECTTLYEAGCPREDILRWLDSIEQNIQISKTCARFYICKAEVLKSSENLEEVLKVYESAVINGAQPSHELAVALTSIVKDVCQEREKKARRRSVTDVQEDNIFESSAIKYTVRQQKKRRKSASDVKQTSPCVVITPVRRSTRRSVSCLPLGLQDKTPTYKSLEDLSDNDRKKMLFFPNEALNDMCND